jgi:hypothetical protein
MVQFFLLPLNLRGYVTKGVVILFALRAVGKVKVRRAATRLRLITILTTDWRQLQSCAPQSIPGMLRMSPETFRFVDLLKYLRLILFKLLPNMTPRICFVKTENDVMIGALILITTTTVSTAILATSYEVKKKLSIYSLRPQDASLVLQ